MENRNPLTDYDEWPLIVASNKPVTDPETVDKIQAEFDRLKEKLEEQANG